MLLDEFCMKIIITAKARNLYFSDFLLLLYNTGIRFSERDPSLWTFIDESTYSLKALKRNNPRIIAKSLMPPTFLAHLSLSFIPAYNLSFSTFNRQLKYLLPSTILIDAEKNILSHLFRHNFVKKLKLGGYSDVMIQGILGEKHLSSAQHYIYSNIIIK